MIGMGTSVPLLSLHERSNVRGASPSLVSTTSSILQSNLSWPELFNLRTEERTVLWTHSTAAQTSLLGHRLIYKCVWLVLKLSEKMRLKVGMSHKVWFINLNEEWVRSWFLVKSLKHQPVLMYPRYLIWEVSSKKFSSCKVLSLIPISIPNNSPNNDSICKYYILRIKF